MIDAAILARGAGFVGVQRSTMSLVASLRVRDWNGGPVKLVSTIFIFGTVGWLVDLGVGMAKAQWWDGHSKL